MTSSTEMYRVLHGDDTGNVSDAIDRFKEDAKDASRSWTITRVSAAVAVFSAFLLIMVVLWAPKGERKEGLGISSFVLLAAIWLISGVFSVVLVHMNYRTANKILIPASSSYRNYKLTRLMMTIPIYTTVNHLLILAFLSQSFVDELWGLESVFHYDTMIQPRYLLFCLWSFLWSAVAGGAAIAAKKEWNDDFFWVFTGSSTAGWLFGACTFIVRTLSASKA